MGRQAANKLAYAALQVFAPATWDEEQEATWTGYVVPEIEGMADEVIEAGTKHMLRRRKRKDGMPSVAECVEYCEEADRWIKQKQGKENLQIEEQPAVGHLEWTADRQKLASDLILCALGKQAAKEGWIKSLWNFARKNGRLPQPNEIEGCKREHKEFHETYAKLVVDAAKLSPKKSSDSTWIHIGDASGSVLARAWLTMGDEMIKRQKELADYVLKNVR